MRLTHAQARQLGGVAAEAVDRIEAEGFRDEDVGQSIMLASPGSRRAWSQAMAAARQPGTKGDGMNKTERAFAAMLGASQADRLIRRWWREPTKFWLAGNTTYRPDFLVVPVEVDMLDVAGNRLAFCELKGFMRDDAAVKLKVAAAMYPCFRWLLVTRDGRHGWSVRDVTATGIGREPVQVDWIRGG